jgi:hypothetical protein
MRFTLATVALVASLMSSASAHMIMTEPAQWTIPDVDAETGNQAPLKHIPSDFPCQGAAAEEVAAEYMPGNKYDLKLAGSAVHGGGSAQMLISYKFPPSNNPEDWRVLTSWMGQHPASPGDNNYPADPTFPNPDNGNMKFTIHEGLPSGKAIVAWSWFNKIGNREMYMKCSTVSIGGSSEEAPDAMNEAAVKALPIMFKANTGECETPSANIKFPYPGKDVVEKGELTEIGADSGCYLGAPGGGDGASTTTPETPETPTQSEAPAQTSAAATYAPQTPDEETNNEENAPAPPAGGCTEGAVVCNPDGTWSQCGSGQLWNMGGVGGGNTCKDGKIMPAKSRRSLRAHRAARRANVHRH